MAEQTVPTHVYTTPDTFQIWLADDIQLDFPPNRLHLDDRFQLVKAKVLDSRTDEDGHFKLHVHVDGGDPAFPANIWCIYGQHCWDNAKDATVALLKRRIADIKSTMDSVLELPDMMDKHDGLLDGQFDEETIKYDHTTGDMIMLLTTRIAPVLGSFVSDAAKLLIQYRRIRKEEQEAVNAD